MSSSTRSTILNLVGSGRSTATRQRRRANRFPRGVVRLGADLVINPGMRACVSQGFVLKHANVILDRMRAGVLMVKDEKMRTLSENELRELLWGTNPASNEGAPPPELSEPEKAEEAPGEPEKVADPGESETDEGEVGDEEPAEGSEEVEEETGEIEPEGDESTSETKGVPGSERPTLPEGWQSFDKRGLLQLMEEGGIALPKNPSKQNLIKTITKWAKG